MHIRIAPHHSLYADTHGQPLDPARPTLVLVHGVLGDHSVWAQQGQALAGPDMNVLAIDLPGHLHSATAPPPARVEEAAAAVWALLDALGLAQVTLAGHSWGSLIALHAAASQPQRCRHLVLVGVAYPMRVAPALLELASSSPQQAMDMISTLSCPRLSPDSPPEVAHAHQQQRSQSYERMQRVWQSQTQHNLLALGLHACDSYQSGVQDMAASTCPVTFVLGDADRMTPHRAAQPLIEAAGPRARVTLLPAGHDLMAQAPDGVLHALRQSMQPD